MTKSESKPAEFVKPVKSEEEFVRKYQELCKEQGFQLAAIPLWGQSKDTGDYRLVVQIKVVPVEKQ